MARFRGTLIGSHSEVSRLGGKKSGLKLSANGWNFGVEVVLSVDQFGKDVAMIYLTAGSNQKGPGKLLGRFGEFLTKKEN